LRVPTDKEGWSFNWQHIQGIGIHNAEHHRNCTQRREPHKKLQKNKEMAVIIKNYNIICDRVKQSVQAKSGVMVWIQKSM
jgi:hypothetical protein